MNEERKTYMADEDIEDLLSPKCDFHTSPEFMERVIAEAEAYSASRRKHRLWRMYYGAAAAVAALVVITILVGNKMETQPNAPVIASVVPSIEKYHPNPHSPHVIEEEISEEKPEKENIHIKNNKMVAKNSVENSVIKEEESLESLESTVETLESASMDAVKHDQYAAIEGPMKALQDKDQKTSGKLMLSTDEIDDYTRLVRRTYIERVRYEIAETETYIREMRENVLESI